MTPTEVIEILTTHNSWRRGADIDLCDLPKPFVIGEAIDEAVRLLKSHEVDHLINEAINDCCPICGSEEIITSIYCNKCQGVV